jgi:ribosomal protein S18 acetylase RimI-like enzyme
MAEREILIRAAVQEDLKDILYLYTEYMFDSHFSKLGNSFVENYLKVILKSKNCITLVASENHAVGFIMAAFDCRSLSRELFFNIQILLSCIKQVLAHPGLAFKSLGLIFYPFNAGVRDVNSELLFITIEPGHRNKDLGVNLIKKALDLIKERGIREVKVSTLTANEAVNKLLKKLGFELEKTFKLFGKNMYLYVHRIC